MSRGQNAGRSYNVKIDNTDFEKLVQFKYSGKTPNAYKYQSVKN